MHDVGSSVLPGRSSHTTCSGRSWAGWPRFPHPNGQRGNVHDVGSQALYGNGTALSPPLWLLAVWGLFVFMATRSGWLGKLGAVLTFLTAVFYGSAAELGELTTNTSPLTGAK